jgi:hypothetical protein
MIKSIENACINFYKFLFLEYTVEGALYITEEVARGYNAIYRAGVPPTCARGWGFPNMSTIQNQFVRVDIEYICTIVFQNGGCTLGLSIRMRYNSFLLNFIHRSFT